MNQTTIAETKEEKPKTKGVGRISRLFQKKPNKKKTMTSSASAMSMSDPSSIKHTFQSSSSIASSHISTINATATPKRSSSLESRSIPTSSINSMPNTATNTTVSHSNNNFTDNASIHSHVTRTMSISSHQSLNNHNHTNNPQQFLAQQRQILENLDAKKLVYQIESGKLTEQIEKLQAKITHRSHELDTLNHNYQTHLKSIRPSNDNKYTIKEQLIKLRSKIVLLASELLPHAQAEVTPEKLSALWLNLGDSIAQLGKPLPPKRIQMLTEKFMMDVLVQNLNINLFPGLSCNDEFLVVQNWLEQYDTTSTFFPTRLRQELSMLVMQSKDMQDDGIEQVWKKCVDRSWSHLYKGLQKAYPSYLVKKSSLGNQQIPNGASDYCQKLHGLVQDAVSLGSAIKGQEVCITAADVREGMRLFDPVLMDDEDGQTEGIIGFCISPPFLVKENDRYETLVKGRVLCMSNNDNTKQANILHAQ